MYLLEGSYCGRQRWSQSRRLFIATQRCHSFENEAQGSSLTGKSWVGLSRLLDTMVMGGA